MSKDGPLTDGDTFGELLEAMGLSVETEIREVLDALEALVWLDPRRAGVGTITYPAPEEAGK